MIPISGEEDLYGSRNEKCQDSRKGRDVKDWDRERDAEKAGYKEGRSEETRYEKRGSEEAGYEERRSEKTCNNKRSDESSDR